MRLGSMQRQLAWHGRGCMTSRRLARSQPRNAAHMQACAAPAATATAGMALASAALLAPHPTCPVPAGRLQWTLP